MGDDIEAKRLAERIRAACLKALIEAHEDAGVQGLCAEGRWEAAVSALERLDVSDLVEPPKPLAR